MFSRGRLRADIFIVLLMIRSFFFSFDLFNAYVFIEWANFIAIQIAKNEDYYRCVTFNKKPACQVTICFTKIDSWWRIVSSENQVWLLAYFRSNKTGLTLFYLHETWDKVTPISWKNHFSIWIRPLSQQEHLLTRSISSGPLWYINGRPSV